MSFGRSHRCRPAVTLCWLCAVLAVVFAPSSASFAAPPRVLPAGQLPEDERLQPLKDLNGYFPFQPPASRADWKSRSEQVKRRMLVALGLWPMPTRTPLNPEIHGRIDQGDYTVEKVYFESLPGFYVTGSLYRPKNADGKRPGVLCPHGHWSEGRFYDCGEAAVRKLIVGGEERFEDGGRSPLQSRCVQLARMGCVVFHYDMIGYADSVQISSQIAHRFAKQRPEMNTQQRWGLFSPQAESHLQSVMGLQALSSSRALDFLEGLPDVDPKRLAMTGASGGGTQTFILSALDPRIAVSVPAVMVSTAMQGGCTCENACLLRIGTGNVEFAAQFAPKPLCLTAANDWTKEMETKGFPELKEHFKVMGAISHVELNAFTWFGHNYNYVSRSAMYQWMNKHLRLGLKSPVVEQAYPRLTAEELTVWDDQHPKPEGGDEFERELLEGWHRDAQRQLDALLPQDASSLTEFQRVVGGAIDVVVGEGMPAADQVEFAVDRTTEHERFSIAAGRTRNKHLGSELPTLLVEPKTDPSAVTVWVDGEGKSGLFTADGKLRPAVQRLVDNGVAVLGVDLLYQGEFLKEGTSLEKTPKVTNPREAACYTFGYNDAVFAQRVHDVLTMVALAKETAGESAPVYLVGLNGAGPWASAALTAGRNAVDKAAIDTGGFRFADVKDIHSPDFLPGGAKYFDLSGMIAMGAPTALWLAGEGETLPTVIDVVYRTAEGATPVMDTGKAEGRDGRAVDWLIE